jgi:hypothetical protein
LLSKPEQVQEPAMTRPELLALLRDVLDRLTAR